MPVPLRPGDYLPLCTPVPTMLLNVGLGLGLRGDLSAGGAKEEPAFAFNALGKIRRMLSAFQYYLFKLLVALLGS